jgi:hypothetical protein
MADPITLGALALTAAGAATTAAGTIAGGNAAAAAGDVAQQGKNFEAVQLGQQAQESRASAQRGALDKRRQTRLLQSTLFARAAAGGGDTADTDIVNLSGDIAVRGEYEALLDMYKGENRARGLEDAATGARMTGEALAAEGQAKRKAAQLSALGTIIGGAGSMYKTYNKLPSYG